MISVDKLNEHLMGNVDAIISILEELQLPNIRPNFTKREIRCSRDEGRNPSSLYINVDTLYYVCFSTGENGSIYSLIMAKTGKTFPRTLKWVAEALQLEAFSLQKTTSTKLPFGGFFKKIVRQIEEPELHMKQYDISILNEYENKYNLLFCRDGISYNTQEYFDVGYDEVSNRITIPQWDVNGNLVGVMGRLNEINAPKEWRWMPVVPCQRSYTLFGYHINYQDIQNEQICYIGESEKFVMQLHSMGIRNAIATCGCNISKTQARYIKALMCKKIIICFDEGLSEDMIIEQARKLKIDTPIYKNSVGYIYDKSGVLLPADTKNSPSDLGEKVFNELVENHVNWL